MTRWMRCLLLLLLVSAPQVSVEQWVSLREWFESSTEIPWETAMEGTLRSAIHACIVRSGYMHALFGSRTLPSRRPVDLLCPSLVAGRKVAQFGFRYDYEAQAVDLTPVSPPRRVPSTPPHPICVIHPTLLV